ncbi:uncharacterized protein LOC142976557 [Anticarsia gemmatalis]|uniref:uncharacterized protein LOC142976557 n=1 Tax=Anticarsia gemmatalis TaxID=129554 RepID=UPI003F757A60
MDVKMFKLFAIASFTLLGFQTVSADVEWVSVNINETCPLIGRAVVAGYEAHDSSPLWVIRANYKNDLVPGKLALIHRVAYIAYGGGECAVSNDTFEVCCADPEEIEWIQSHDGYVPRKAIAAGFTSKNETLYVGRVKYRGALTPGKIQPSHQLMYFSFRGKELTTQVYEVLCSV